MHGLGLDEDVRSWFPPPPVPRSTVDPGFVRSALRAR
jgi:hypothetical protein